MRLSAVAFFMILTTVFLSGCGKDEMASLVDHGGSFYSNHGVMSLGSHGQDSQQVIATAAPIGERVAVTQPANGWQWPVDGPVTEVYGSKDHGAPNEGIVIAASEGTPIRAAQAGEVIFVGNDANKYGNIVILRHEDGDMTSYSHAQSISVKKGEHVVRGAVIALVGKSGNANEPMLHFAVREGNHGVDPLTKLPQQVASN